MYVVGNSSVVSVVPHFLGWSSLWSGGPCQ